MSSSVNREVRTGFCNILVVKFSQTLLSKNGKEKKLLAENQCLGMFQSTGARQSKFIEITQTALSHRKGQFTP